MLFRYVPRSRIVVEDLSAIQSMMRGEFDFVWVPAWIEQEPLREGLLVKFLRDWRVAETTTHAVCLDRRHTPSRIRSLLDGLQVAAQERSFSIAHCSDLNVLGD